MATSVTNSGDGWYARAIARINASTQNSTTPSADASSGSGWYARAMARIKASPQNSTTPVSNTPSGNSTNTLAQNFIKSFDGVKNADGNVIKDGKINKDEYKVYLQKQLMPTNITDKLFSIYGTDNNLSELQIINMYKSIDKDNDSIFSFEENLAFQNSVSDTQFDTSINQKQYNSLFSMAITFIKSLDKDKDANGNLTSNGKISKTEIKNYFESNNLKNGDEDVEKFINYFDNNVNKDGEIDILEYQKKLIKFDKDEDGKISVATKDNDGNIIYGENKDLDAIITRLSGAEISAKNFIKDIDGEKNEKGKLIEGSQNGTIDYIEYKAYLASNNLPQNMAFEMFDKYSIKDANNNDVITYDVLAKVINDFDMPDVNGVKDGSLNFTESIAFQNSISSIQFDAAAVSQKQYTNLYNSGLSFMSFDLDKDGTVDINEYKAALNKPNSKTGATQPEYYAENLMMLFDKDQSNAKLKDGKLDIFEYMKGLMQFDNSKDGQLNLVEALSLKNNLDNTRLFNNINESFLLSDFNNDKNLSLNEFKDYIAAKNLTTNLAGNTITKFDLDKDESLSIYEMMNMYKKFDVNNNNTIEADEETSFYNSI